MKEEIVKIETVPTKLTELEKRKDELTKLVTDTSLITINGIKDIEGYKTAEKNRKLVKKEIGIIEKTRKEIKAPVLKIGLEIDNVAKELTAILEPENKRLVTITKAHEAEVEAEKQRQIQEQKDKTIKRIKDIHDCKPDFDGYTYSFGEITINLDKIEALTDEAFNNELNCFKTIRIDLDKEAKKEEERIAAKEKEDRTVISYRRAQVEPYKDIMTLFNDKDRLLSISEEDLTAEIENAKLLVLRKEEANKERKKEAERLNIQAKKQEEAQKIIDNQLEEIRVAQEKVKQEAEQLERERKAKEAKDLAIKKALEDEENAKKAKIKADKEAEEKRKADVERQDRLKDSKRNFNLFLHKVDNLESVLDEIGVEPEPEVKSLIKEFWDAHDLLIKEYEEKINNL